MAEREKTGRQKKNERIMTLDRAQAIRADLVKTQKAKAEADAAAAREEAARASKEAERRKAAEAHARAAATRRILACGDVAGSLDKLFTTVEAQSAKVGSFDALLCVGAFSPEAGTKETSLVEYFGGQKKAAVPTFFIDVGSALLHSAPRGQQICDNLSFLGGYGVRDICGLRVAFLSGVYNPSVYEMDDADFVGEAFTSRAIRELQRLVAEDPKRRGIDMLLTCGWPANIEQSVRDEESRPPELTDGQPWRTACAQPLAELCFAIEPRYHLFGTADIFYQRPPFQVLQRGHLCRCIGLGRVGSTSKQRKWLHAFSLSPMAFMKREELRQLPSTVTPCPFAACQKRSASEPAEAPAVKRRALPSQVDGGGLPEQAIAALMAGDFHTYDSVAVQLRDTVIECGAAVVEEASTSAKRPAERPGAGQALGDEAGSASASPEFSKDRSAAGTTMEPGQAKKKDNFSEEEKARMEAATDWLSRPPRKGVVRYTFPNEGQLGLRLSRDVPPWILEVRDGSLSARKAPRVPLGGIILAVNGHELTEKGREEAIAALANRPVVLDIEWPLDQGTPTVNRA